MDNIEKLYDELRAKFDMRGAYFYPLSGTSYKDLIVYDSYKLMGEEDEQGNDDLEENTNKIISILKEIGVNELLCNSDYDGLFKTDVSKLWLGVGEVYWFDSSLEWVIYVSHEAPMTFAGPKLVEKITEVFGDSYIATDWV